MEEATPRKDHQYESGDDRKSVKAAQAKDVSISISVSAVNTFGHLRQIRADNAK